MLPEAEPLIGDRIPNYSDSGPTALRDHVGDDPSAGSPTETLLRLLLPLTKISSVGFLLPRQDFRPPEAQSGHLTNPFNR